MRLFVGVTDRSQYVHLRRLPVLDEVNLCQPSRRLFVALESIEHPLGQLSTQGAVELCGLGSQSRLSGVN